VTDVLADVLNKPPAWTYVIIQEVELEVWGAGGLPTMEWHKQTADKSAS
jgi:4-oxalocrotonate tautomerase